MTGGGMYRQPQVPTALLQYLLACFSGTRATRALLALPASRGLVGDSSS